MMIPVTRHGETTVEVRNVTLSSFRHLLARVDPQWSSRPSEEQEEWVHWYDRTARAISRQYARSFRDPSHDAQDVLQEILVKILIKFGSPDAPHRLLTERPCIRNLMKWKGLDQVDWENASRRNAHLRANLPDDDIGLTDRAAPPPEAPVELRDLERGKREVDRQIDLHGRTVAEDLASLQVELGRARERGLRYLLVVTGRGKRSPMGPRIRPAVQDYLARGARPHVLWFQPAPPRLGGAGAFLLRLRRPGAEGPGPGAS